jgi:uncharacterized protein YndB with AHSA1/START domain
VRYRDGPTVEVEERIAGDPDRVWKLVTDITLPARFSSELQSVDWLDGATEVAIGNRFRGTNRREDLGDWQTECRIIEVEPERRWVWEVHALGGVLATWGFEVDPGRDGVRVRQWARMGPGRSGVTMAIEANPDKEARIISHRLADWRRNMEANLAGIRRIVEGEAD